MKKAYLDFNIIVSIAKDGNDGEMPAIDRLLELLDEAKVTLVTSQVAGDELKNYQDAAKAAAQRRTYLRFAKVPFIQDQTVLGFHNQWDRWGGVSYPFVGDDPVARSLRDIGLDRTDAHHVMLAIKSGCDYFVTCDGKSILTRKANVEARHRIKLVKPSEVVPLLV
jgi:predicted nucleic acid-binding protein